MVPSPFPEGVQHSSLWNVLQNMSINLILFIRFPESFFLNFIYLICYNSIEGTETIFELFDFSLRIILGYAVWYI